MRLLTTISRSGLRLFLVLLGSTTMLSMGAMGSQGLEAARATGTPKISCEEATAEWGDLIKGTPFEHTFQIRNDGDAVLIIQKVNGT